MSKRDKKVILYSFLAMAVLLAIRIVFFLKDGTNDLIELILIITIYALSFVTLVYYAYVKMNKSTSIIKKHKDKFLLISYLLLLEYLFKLKIGYEMHTTYLFTVLFGISLIIFISLIIPSKFARIYDLFFATFFFIYVFGQDIYYTLFTGLFSFKDIVTIGEGADFAEGIYRFSYFHVMYVIVFMIFLVLYLRSKEITHVVVTKRKLLLLLEVPLVLFLLFNLNAIYPVKSARLHTSDHYLYYSNFDSAKLASKFSLINLIYRDLGDVITPSFDYKRNMQYLDEYFETHEKAHMNNDYSDIYEGKNLIFILAESYDDIALSKELTPNIYKLKTEGLDFQNHYTPVYPRTTCDTEVILNTGLIPSITDGPTCYMFNENSYENSLAALFNEKGYETTALHSNNRDFYTRDIVYNGFGYDTFLGQEDMSLSDTDKRYDSLFETLAKDLIIKDDPFFSFAITLSGHSPYKESNLAASKHYSEVDEFYGTSIPESVKNFIATQIEVDQFVGNLMEDLETNGKLNDTVIVFANDHYPYTLEQDDYELVSGIVGKYEKQRGSLYIWSNDTDNEVITDLSSSFDVLPTLANMFGLDIDYIEYIGNDVFDDSLDSLVYFKDYTVYDGQKYFNITDEEMNVDIEKYNMAKEYYEYCIKVLKTDYFSN